MVRETRTALAAAAVVFGSLGVLIRFGAETLMHFIFSQAAALPLTISVSAQAVDGHTSDMVPDLSVGTVVIRMAKDPQVLRAASMHYRCA
jgi:hypothetical protein